MAQSQPQHRPHLHWLSWLPGASDGQGSVEVVPGVRQRAQVEKEGGQGHGCGFREHGRPFGKVAAIPFLAASGQNLATFFLHPVSRHVYIQMYSYHAAGLRCPRLGGRGALHKKKPELADCHGRTQAVPPGPCFPRPGLRGHSVGLAKKGSRTQSPGCHLRPASQKGLRGTAENHYAQISRITSPKSMSSRLRPGTTSRLGSSPSRSRTVACMSVT